MHAPRWPLAWSRPIRLALLALAVITIHPAASADEGGQEGSLFFLHHSTGRNLIVQGEARDVLEGYNEHHGTAFGFWDHDYNHIGLKNPPGDLVGHDYGVPDDNTDPDGLHVLWTTDNAARDSMLANHDVIAFKSCFPASAIESDAQLEQRQRWYLEMRDVFDQHPDHVFVVMSQPPLHRLRTDTEEADRARAFARWLTSDAYLQGHPNVVGFDLFDHLAHPDDGSEVRNMLRWEYESSHDHGDSHPNELANETVGPVLITFLAEAWRDKQTTGVGAATPRPAGARILGAHPNPFNPRVELVLDLPRPAPVRLEICDLAGRRVAVLHAGSLAAGRRTLSWDGRSADGAPAPSGVYRAVLRTATAASATTITLLK